MEILSNGDGMAKTFTQSIQRNNRVNHGLEMTFLSLNLCRACDMTPAIAVRFPGSANNSIETRLSNREPQMTILSPITGHWFRRRFANCLLEIGK
jgi:hypothetical protein